MCKLKLHFCSSELMALSRNLQLSSSFAVTAIIFLSLTLLPPQTGGISTTSRKYDEELRKMILGSRPPACLNKCMNCRPCEATLTIPPHKNTIINDHNYNYHEELFHREDGSYYLLSWKCSCGNKLYQP